MSDSTGKWSNSFQDQHDNVHHKGKLTHDAVAGAVAFGAIKLYEDRLAKSGKPDNHAMAKEFLGGLVAAGLTHLVETKGLDAWDAHKRKQVQEQAEKHVETVLVDQYSTSN